MAFEALHHVSYAELLAELANELEARPDQRLELWWSEVETFACSRCGMGCRRPWQVQVSQSYVRQWAQPLSELTGLAVSEIFVPLPEADTQAWAHLGKKPGSEECVLLDAEGLCTLHRRWGASAKPEVCQYYPYTGLQSASAYNSPALALSCTRAARMLSEPQRLCFRFIPDQAGSRLQAVGLTSERQLNRSAWLLWTGHLLDGLTMAGGFSAWLGSMLAALQRLLDLPFELLRPDDLEPLEPLPAAPALAPDARADLFAWLGRTVLGPGSGLEAILPWCLRVALDQELPRLTPAESETLEGYLKAYWLRQLLLPAHLLRGELNLVQQMLVTGIQGTLIRLWALYLRDLGGGPLSPEYLAEAANQVYLLVVRDQVPGSQRSWRRLETDACLSRLAQLARWREAIFAPAEPPLPAEALR